MILLYGATGHTGRRIAQTLSARGLRFAVGGRNPRRLAALERTLGPTLPAVTASLDPPARLWEHLRPFEWVVNCVGPFEKSGRALAEAAIRAGTHYLDISGDGSTVRALGSLHDDASRGGRLLLPGIGAVGALGDCLADRALGALASTPRRIDVIYVQSAEQIFGLSEGSVKSALRQLRTSQPEADEAVVSVDLPAPFGSGWGVRVDGPEAALVSRRLGGLPVRTFYAPDPGHPLHAWMAAGLQYGGSSLSRWESLWGSAWGRAHRTLYAQLARRVAPSSGGGVFVRATGRGEAAECFARFEDAYDTSAQIVARVMELLSADGPGRVGLQSSASVLNGAQLLRALEAEGVIQTLQRLTGDHTR